MYVTITEEDGIEVYKTWTEVKKHTSFKKEDFTPVGKDFVLNTTQDTYEIVKDIKLLENVAAQKMFTKNKMDFIDLITIINTLLVFMILVK